MPKELQQEVLKEVGEPNSSLLGIWEEEEQILDFEYTSKHKH